MRSLTTKLTLAFLLIGLTGAILVAIIVQHSTQTAFNRFILNREQQSLVDGLVQYYQESGSWQGLKNNLTVLGVEGSQNFDRRPIGSRMDTFFTLVAADRSVIISNEGKQAGQQISARDLSGGVPLEVNGSTVGWLLLTSSRNPWIPKSPEAIFLGSVNRAAMLSALIAAALALILGGFLAYTLTRALRELTAATHEISRGRLGLQVKVRSRDEVGELAASFNTMSADLEKTTAVRRQMTADIAHDLRTPLSVLLGYTEALNDGKLPGNAEVYGVLYQQTRQMSRLVEDLRTLSLADAGELPLVLQSIQPESLLEGVIARHSLAAGQKGISLRRIDSDPLEPITVDPDRMDQVFDNLVRNALRYTPEGGEILLSASQQSDRVLIRVQDTGCGIREEDLVHIFDRFYRGDKSRWQTEESGLGLAIAKSIIELHGGSITVESQAGQGTTFTLSLPVSVSAKKT